MKILRHVAVFLRRELVTTKHYGALGSKAPLAIFAFVTRSDGIDCNPITFFKTIDCTAQLVNDPDGFMSQDPIPDVSEPTGNGVYVGSADHSQGSLDDGIIRTGLRNGPINHFDFVDTLHD